MAIYDLTYYNVEYDLEDIINLSTKLAERYKGTTIMYAIQVWADEGIYYFDWKAGNKNLIIKM
ncbi:hypothetical protein Q0F98_03150 [Paenibacillus amylolyticus]|nr:hypothetical protein Q0F98_03150 [Paenibacillus amylolyticus]